jgi:3-hydroxyisobutyrate dehydrogenase-like beta-hydroxyacid dehydrogenase
VKVGLLHPGEMGTAVGAALVAGGHEVLWASDGRSAETAGRAEAAGFRDAGTVEAMDADVLLSICPPHAAVDVARSAAGFAGIYVDANAVSPATARSIAAFMPSFVDGGIIGPPPRAAGDTRLYLSGPAGEVAGLFERTIVDARVISTEPGAASALKMVYAAWSKGTAALLLAILEVARAEGVEEDLRAEWRDSLPELLDREPRALRSGETKGWRWAGEMEEIASTFGAAGQPPGFHAAAAEVFRRFPRPV